MLLTVSSLSELFRQRHSKELPQVLYEVLRVAATSLTLHQHISRTGAGARKDPKINTEPDQYYENQFMHEIKKNLGNVRLVIL